MRHGLTAMMIGALALLAACGTNERERTTGGAAAGAATEARIGALAGPPGAVIDALVGGGAGAATGATTTPDQVNLGKPPWPNPKARVPAPSGATRTASRRRGPSDSSASEHEMVERLNEQSLQQATMAQPESPRSSSQRSDPRRVSTQRPQR
jgi:hypothetical protein